MEKWWLISFFFLLSFALFFFFFFFVCFVLFCFVCFFCFAFLDSNQITFMHDRFFVGSSTFLSLFFLFDTFYNWILCIYLFGGE